MTKLEAVVFDWGNTLMRVLAFEGPMAHWPQVTLIPGVKEVLATLAGRVVCGVASNAGDSDAELMGQALARVGIRQYFDHLWTSKELGATKPELDFFRGVLARLALPPWACVMVGDDYEKDIWPARVVGMRAVWFAEGQPGTSVDGVIHSMADLVAVLEQIDEWG